MVILNKSHEYLSDGIEFDLAACIAEALESVIGVAPRDSSNISGYLDSDFPKFLEILSMPQFRRFLEQLHALAWHTALAPVPGPSGVDGPLSYRIFQIVPRPAYPGDVAKVSSKYGVIGINKISQERQFALLPTINEDRMSSGSFPISLLPVGAVVSSSASDGDFQSIGLSSISFDGQSDETGSEVIQSLHNNTGVKHEENCPAQ